MPNDADRDAELDIGTKTLVDDLLSKPTSFARDELLHRARRYRYHDYKSDDPFCSITLVKHLKNAGFRDLAQNAADGKYDQQKDASDEWAETTDEGREATRILQDPDVVNAGERLKEALKKNPIPRYVVPDDGPPEPGGGKGEA